MHKLRQVLATSILHRALASAFTVCTVAVSAVALSVPAMAQTLTGSIGGDVTDSTGAAIPDATVTATSSALIKGAVTVQTDAKGYYKFLELPPGTYRVSIKKDGFTSYVASGITVNSAVSITSDAKLNIGSISQEIEVNGAAVTIDTENVASQQVLGQELLEGVPTGRNPWAEANMVPAVVPNVRDVGGSTGMQASTMTVHGSSTADQRFMIDGVNVTWAGLNGGSTAIYYDQGMFQEINYRVGALPADVGPSGVYMNMVTKDGSNSVHGNIFANGAGQGMQSSNVNAALAAMLRKNVVGAQQNNPNLLFGNPTTINYDYNGQIGGPLLRDKLWYFGSFRWWKVNNLVSGAFNPDNTAAINDNLIANEMVKFSYSPSSGSKNHFSLMYNRNQKNRYHRRNTPPYFIPDKASFLQNQPGSVVIAKWVYTPTSKWVIDTGAGYTHIKYPQRYEPGVLPTDISATDSALSTLTGAAQYSYINPTWRLSLSSSASALLKAAGTHNVRLGGEFTHDYFAQLYIENGNLQAIYNNGAPLNAALATTPINQQTNNMNTLAFYVQDSWKVTSRLTFDLGLRYEYLQGYIPAQTSPASPWLNLRTGSTATTRTFAAQHDVPNWKYFTPRLGVSWDVTGRGRTVIKASFSKYMQGAGMNLLTNLNPLQYFTNSVPWKDLNGDGIPEYYGTVGATTADCALDSRNEFCPAAGSGFAASYQQAAGLRRPNSWEQSIGVQQRLPFDFILTVSGWHRATSDQIGRYNASVPVSGYTPVVITNPATGAPLTVYNQTAASAPLAQYVLVNSPLLNNEYRGLDVNIQKNLSHHFMVEGGASFSRFRGAITGDLNTTLDDLNNPNYNINRIGAYPNYDVPVQFKLAGTYQMPYKFEVSGGLQHASGQAVTENYTLTSAILGPGQTLHQSQTIIVVPSGPIRLAETNLLDMRVARPIRFHERYLFKPEFDVYNLTNSAAVTAVNQSINNAALALNPTTILPPRLFKVGAQFQF